jgi:hypothetical protein
MANPLLSIDAPEDLFCWQPEIFLTKAGLFVVYVSKINEWKSNHRPRQGRMN